MTVYFTKIDDSNNITITIITIITITMLLITIHIIVECINVSLKRRTEDQNLKLKISLKSPPTKRRLSTALNVATSDQGICCFCKCIDKQENLVAVGTPYEIKTKIQIDHVKYRTANWIEIAKVLQDEHLLIKIWDVASNDMYYHKSSIKCSYQKHRKRYIEKLKEKDKVDEITYVERWFKIHLLNKVIHHIKQTESRPYF